MKIYNDEPEPVIELTSEDLADVQTLALIAEQVEPGSYVYVPAADTTPATTRDMKEPREDASGRSFYTDPDPVRMHTERLDDPARLDALRSALASHGLELRHKGAFYSRVEAMRAGGKRCAS